MALELYRAAVTVSEDEDGITLVIPPEARGLAFPHVIKRIADANDKPVRIATYPR